MPCKEHLRTAGYSTLLKPNSGQRLVCGFLIVFVFSVVFIMMFPDILINYFDIVLVLRSQKVACFFFKYPCKPFPIVAVLTLVIHVRMPKITLAVGLINVKYVTCMKCRSSWLAIMASQEKGNIPYVRLKPFSFNLKRRLSASHHTNVCLSKPYRRCYYNPNSGNTVDGFCYLYNHFFAIPLIRVHGIIAYIISHPSIRCKQYGVYRSNGVFLTNWWIDW